MHRCLVGLVALFVVACGGGSSAINFAGLKAGPRTAKFQDRIFSRKLSNGMRIAVLPDDRTNLVTVTVRYEVGSSDELAGNAGLAHYVEHLLYEPPVAASAHAAIGESSLDGNAFTSFDRTYFYTTSLDLDLDRQLELAARRFDFDCNALDDEALARERDVVIQEKKRRSQFSWDAAAIGAAVWGPDHPYAHSIGARAFSTVHKPEVCAFIEQHYGPASASVVVTGHVDDAGIERIVMRLDRIPGRAQVPREATPATKSATSRVAVPGLDKPVVMMVFDLPNLGGSANAAVSLLDGTPVTFATRRKMGAAFVTTFGEERARVLVAIAEAKDLDEVPFVEQALRAKFASAEIADLGAFKQRAYLGLLASFDDIAATGSRIADLLAHDQPLNRYRAIEEVFAVKSADVKQLLDQRTARIITLVPEANGGSHHIAEALTEMHHVDISHDDTVDPGTPALPSARVPRQLVAYQLANGLRVWLAPDPRALTVDARVVVPTGRVDNANRLLATQAVYFHSGPDGDDDRVRWYRANGAPLRPRVDATSTTFAVAGSATYGDWHVWNLAWTIVQGRFPDRLDDVSGHHIRLGGDSDSPPPRANEVAMRRLAGLPDGGIETLQLASRDELAAFWDANYGPAQSTLIVSGKFDVERMRAEIESLFGPWRGNPRAAEPAKQVARAPSSVAIAVDDAPTVQIAIAFAPTAASPRSEMAAREVLSRILNDRLRVVRESLGVSYDDRTTAVTTTAVMIGAEVDPAYATEATRAFAQEIERVRTGYPELAVDFARARKRVLAAAMADPVGASARAGQLEQIAIDGTPLDQPDRDLEAIQHLDLEAVRRLAAQDLRPDRMIVVLRGPTASVEHAFGSFGINPATVERVHLGHP